jgi:CBS domain containing-hemolysin-like protein
LDIPEGEYHTLGGFILAFHEDIPSKGEKINIERFQFTIEKVSGAKIEEVKMMIV